MRRDASLLYIRIYQREGARTTEKRRPIGERIVSTVGAGATRVVVCHRAKCHSVCKCQESRLWVTATRRDGFRGDDGERATDSCESPLEESYQRSARIKTFQQKNVPLYIKSPPNFPLLAITKTTITYGFVCRIINKKWSFQHLLPTEITVIFSTHINYIDWFKCT